MGKLQDSRKAHGLEGIVAAVLGKYNLSQVATDISHVGPSLLYLCNVNSFSFRVCPWPLERSAPLQTQGGGQVHPSFTIFPLKGFCKQFGGPNHDLFICNLQKWSLNWNYLVIQILMNIIIILTTILYSASYVPGTALSVLKVLTRLFSNSLWKEWTNVIPILQIWKLRHGHV